MGLTDIVKPLPVAGQPPPTDSFVNPNAILDQSQIEDRRFGIPRALDITRYMQQGPLNEVFTKGNPGDDLASQLAQRNLTAASTIAPMKFPGSKSLDMLQQLAKVLGKGGQGGLPGYPMTPGGPRTPYSGPTSFAPITGGRYPIINKNPNPGFDPSQVTPEIQHAALEAWARFPGLTNMGTHVIKNVSGTNTPSQHSYGNAIDIGGPSKSLTELASWAAAHAAKLGVSQIIYQTSIWTTGEGWHPYTGVPHSTHVHLSGPLTYNNTAPNFPTIKFNVPENPAKPRPQRQRTGKAETKARRGRQA